MSELLVTDRLYLINDISTFFLASHFLHPGVLLSMYVRMYVRMHVGT